MTFDDGYVYIYSVTNSSANGDLPQESLTLSGQYYFGEESLGITRYYQALSQNQHIERVIRIWRADITVNQIAVIDSTQYRVKMVQHEVKDGLKITKLSLEREGETFAYTNTETSAD